VEWGEEGRSRREKWAKEGEISRNWSAASLDIVSVVEGIGLVIDRSN
jgi:hypothetical protein